MANVDAATGWVMDATSTGFRAFEAAKKARAERSEDRCAVCLQLLDSRKDVVHVRSGKVICDPCVTGVLPKLERVIMVNRPFIRPRRRARAGKLPERCGSCDRVLGLGRYLATDPRTGIAYCPDTCGMRVTLAPAVSA